MRYPHLFLGIVGLYTICCHCVLSALPTAYVTDNGASTVIPIDTATNTPGAPIPFPSGSDLLFIAITPDGQTAYVTESGTDVVTPIDTATNTLGTPITLGGFPNFSEGIAITPDGSKMFITNPAGGSVIPIDLTTNPPTVGVSITGFLTPEGVAISPDGKTAYVANSGSNTVTPIDLTTNTPQTPVLVGNAPFDMAITPDGTTAYVANASSNTVTPIDLTTNPPTPGAPIPSANKPQIVAITPDGKTAFIANFDTSNITPIDIPTNTAGTPIVVGPEPIGIAITPNGETAYVALFGSVTVVPIDLTTNPPSPQTPIPSGTAPLGIAITPDQAPTASFTFITAEVGLPTSFDASASSSPEGVIVSYSWDFGDSNTLTTANPITNHVYAAPGNYLVTLTVTNSAGTSTTQVYTGHMVLRNGGPSATITHLIAIVSPTTNSPPTHFKGKRLKNKFVAQLEYFNSLSWEPPNNNPDVVEYRLRRNGQVIAEIPADSPLIFKDHNRKKNEVDVYTLVAVYSLGVESLPVELILP
ncbi:MAG: PKD domain-containing protein [Candidatus Rhabdochlamydia sp.]